MRTSLMLALGLLGGRRAAAPAAAPIISDAFTDTNGKAITQHVIAPINTPGVSWELAARDTTISTTTIQNNAMACSPSKAGAVVDADVNDVDIRANAVFPGGSDNGDPCVMFRYTDKDNFFCVLFQSNRILIGRMNTGSFATLKTFTLSMPAGAKAIRAIVEGTRLWVFYDGVQRLATQVVETAATKHGFINWYDTTGDQITVIDDAEIWPAAGHGLATLVCYGDSITDGSGASDAAHSYVGLIQAAKSPWLTVESGIGSTPLQNTVQNAVAVIGAAVSNNGRDAVATRVVAYEPTHCIILYGLNDLRLNDAAFTSANFQNDLGEVVDAIVAGGCAAGNIIIGSPPYIPEASYATNAPWNGGTTEKHAAYVAACAAVASAKGTQYVDIYQAMVAGGGDTLMHADGIHPNDAGHALIAAAFLSVL